MGRGKASCVLLNFVMETTWELTDTTLVIRCPYCVVGNESRPMTAYKDGRFICRDCAHTVRPGVPEYKCTCRPCLRVATQIYPLLSNFSSKFR